MRNVQYIMMRLEQYKIANKKVYSEGNMSKKNVSCTQLKTIFNTKTIRSIPILIEGKDKPYLLLKIKVCLLHVFESNKTN